MHSIMLQKYYKKFGCWVFIVHMEFYYSVEILQDIWVFDVRCIEN